MKEALVDANVILRYLTRDPPAMAEAALKIFNEARNGFTKRTEGGLFF